MKLQFFMKHPLLNRIKIPVILIIATLLIFLFSGTFGFGKIVNYFSPCQDDPRISTFHCYQIYDFDIMIAMVGIFILSLLTAIVKIILFVRANKKL